MRRVRGRAPQRAILQIPNERVHVQRDEDAVLSKFVHERLQSFEHEGATLATTPEITGTDALPHGPDAIGSFRIVAVRERKASAVVLAFTLPVDSCEYPPIDRVVGEREANDVEVLLS